VARCRSLMRAMSKYEVIGQNNSGIANHSATQSGS